MKTKLYDIAKMALTNANGLQIVSIEMHLFD